MGYKMPVRSKTRKPHKCYNVQRVRSFGRVAQLGEHLLCKQGVAGSIPVTSTKSLGLIAKDLLLVLPAIPRISDGEDDRRESIEKLNSWVAKRSAKCIRKRGIAQSETPRER
jgi:hypothetical protein